MRNNLHIITRASRAPSLPPANRNAPESSTYWEMAQQVCQQVQQTGLWPAVSHPEFGPLMAIAKRQFQRAADGKEVLYTNGYTQKVHALFRQHGYNPSIKGGGPRQRKGTFTAEVRQALQSGTPLTNQQLSKLRNKYNKGEMSDALVKELAAKGITLP